MIKLESLSFRSISHNKLLLFVVGIFILLVIVAAIFMTQGRRFEGITGFIRAGEPPGLIKTNPVRYSQRGNEWNFNFPRGWSTFSLPVLESVPLSVFSQQCPSKFLVMFYFDEKIQNYAQVQPNEDVVPGRGYYVAMLDYCRMKIQGNGRKLSTYFLLMNQWYLIGSAAKPVRVEDIKGNCRNLEVWYFAGGKYRRADILQPLQAYWINSKTEVNTPVNTPSSPPSGAYCILNPPKGDLCFCNSDSDCELQPSYCPTYCPRVVGGDKAKCAPDTHKCYCGGVCGDKYCDEYEKRSGTCEKDCSVANCTKRCETDVDCVEQCIPNSQQPCLPRAGICVDGCCKF